MFKRLGKALSSKNRSKVRLDCSITCLKGLPPSVGAVRVVWARDAKVQMTKLAQVQAGEATWREELSIIATLDKNSTGGYEPKIYDFRIQAPGADQRFVTLGLVTVDMSKFVDARSLPLDLPVNLSGGGGQAVLCITLTSIPVRGLIGDDAASVISGLSGSPNALDGDQDLGGFEMQRGSSPSRMRDPSPASRPPPPPTIEERKSVGLPESTAAALDTIPESAGPASPVGGPSDVDDRLQQRQQGSLSGAGSADLGEALAARGPGAAEELQSAFAGWQQDAENGHEGDAEYDEGLEEYEEDDEEVEEEGEGGYHSGGGFTEADLLELEARLTEAETAAAEAEAVAEEAVLMLEKEQQSRHQAEAMAAQLQRDLDWAAKKAVKERADWEGRMKDSFKKMEGTVLLTERVQREKAEMAERLAVVTAEKNDLEAMFDHKKVEMRVADAVATARVDAEAQAGIEIAALKKRVREMEEYVEEADSRALQAQGKASTLQAQLAGARGAGAPSGDAAWDEVRAAEERADGLSLELQYARAERTAMEEEVRSAKQDADRNIAAARREAEAHAARAAELTRQLEGARTSTVAAERNSTEAQGRMVLLEDALERSNLQAAELRQRLVAAQAQAAHGSGGGVAVVGSVAAAGLASELALAMHEVREVQDAAEARAAQLAATSRELQAAQEALSSAQTELQYARQEAADAHRMVAARDDEVRHLQGQLKAKEMVAMELKQAQRDLAGMYGGGSFSGAGRAQSSRSDSGSAPMHTAGTAAAAMQQQAANGGGGSEAREREHSELEQRAAEAEALARSLSMQTADLVQQLATSQAERLEANAKIGEMRGDIARLRSGSEGQLRQRIETLDRELLVARNRADVNALFREEHERIAGDLIAAKLALAEAQEEIVVLKRSLVKSQERSMGFAAKLTRLETKLYKRLTNAASSVGRRKKSANESSAEELDETSSRPGSRSSRPSSAGSSRAGSLRRKLRMVRLSSGGQESVGEGLQSPTPHQQLTPLEK